MNSHASDRVLGVFGKLSTRRRGAWVLFCFMAFGLAAQKLLNIDDFFTEN
jgi:hypothetical protein